MTERRADKLFRSAQHLQIGNSVMRWEDGKLTAEIDEIGVPIPRRIRGHLTLTPITVLSTQFQLDSAERHRWQPIAPLARIEVEFQNPKLSWRGNAYFDSNEGDAPLAADFVNWHWSRANDKSATKIFYNVKRRDGTGLVLGLEVQPDGKIEYVSPPPEQPLPGTVWRVARSTHSDAAYKPIVLKTLEDAPFYNRSIIRAQSDGKIFDAMHESLDLDRFNKSWVRLLLPFRMPRI
ncbi:MAG: carotenoid 1,2-hydratase [Acidocella sp.]|nr:carotenoid 1,2-hydratase [Acidocella sp.]